MVGMNPIFIADQQSELKKIEELIHSEPEVGYRKSKDLYDSISQIPDSPEKPIKCELLILMAACEYQFGLIKESEKKLQEVISKKHLPANHHLKIQALIQQSKVDLQQNLFTDAYQRLQKALTFAYQTISPDLLGEVILNRSLFYLSIGELNEAINEAQKCYQIFLTTKNKALLCSSHCLCAYLFLQLDDEENFNTHYLKCLNENQNNWFVLTWLYYIKAIYLLEKNQKNECKTYFHKSLTLSKKYGFQRIMVDASLQLLQTESNEQQAEGIEQKLLELLRISKEIYYVNGEMTCSLLLSRHFTQTGDLASALKNQQRYYVLKEASEFEKTNQRIQMIEDQYQTQSLKNEKRIIEQKNQQLEQEILERKIVEEALRKSEDRYRQLATIDPLTNLINRRKFFEDAEKEINRSKRYKHPICLLMIDLDHFKIINDNYGHTTGDDVLQWVSACLISLLREVDLVGRYGGEEFIVLLPETNLTLGKQISSRICTYFQNNPYRFQRKSIYITLSIGLCEFSENVNLDGFIKKTDQALYRAKNTGRNRVSC